MEPVLHDENIAVCVGIGIIDTLNEKSLYCVHDQADWGITMKKIHYDVANHTLIMLPLTPEFPLQTIRLKKSEPHPVIGRLIEIWKELGQ